MSVCALFSVASSHLPALLVNVDHAGAIGKLSLKPSHENHHECLEGTTAARERTCVARSQCVHVPLVVWCTREAGRHASRRLRREDAFVRAQMSNRQSLAQKSVRAGAVSWTLGAWNNAEDH